MKQHIMAMAGFVPVSEGGGNYSITSSQLGIIDSLIGESLAATLSPAVSLDKRLAGFQLAAPAPAVQHRKHRSHQPGTVQVTEARPSYTLGGGGGQVTGVFAPGRAIPCRH